MPLSCSCQSKTTFPNRLIPPMTSIYHFFKSLTQNKEKFSQVKKLEDFPFEDEMLSCRNKGIFPDMAIRITQEGEQFSGGELIEVKDSETYLISSFNSTIPTGKKRVEEFISGRNSKIYKQMQQKGENPYQMPIREVYYLVRGKRSNPSAFKVCLVHGHFFETIKVEELIKEAFSQVLAEGLSESHESLDEDTIEKILSILSRQAFFRRVRYVEQSSVKLRFRIMTEVKAEANILDGQRYPEVSDNTLNLIVPFVSKDDKNQIIEKMRLVFGDDLNLLRQTTIKHPFNGYFLLFQTSI